MLNLWAVWCSYKISSKRLVWINDANFSKISVWLVLFEMRVQQGEKSKSVLIHASNLSNRSL